MKKLFGLIIVVVLLSFPVQALCQHDSTPESVSLTYRLLGGATIQFTTPDIDFGDVMPPIGASFEWLPSATVDVDISYKFAPGQKAVVVCDSLTDLMGTGHEQPIDQFMKHSWNGTILFYDFMPAVGIQQTVWDSGAEAIPARGVFTAQVFYELYNTLEFGMIDMTYVGSVTYTILEMPE